MKKENTKTGTGMEQYQEWFDILEDAGFKRTRSEIGNVDYKHPKRYKYKIKFDWGSVFVFYRFTGMYSTFEIDRERLNAVINAIMTTKDGIGLTELAKREKDALFKKGGN